MGKWETIVVILFCLNVLLFIVMTIYEIRLHRCTKEEKSCMNCKWVILLGNQTIITNDITSKCYSCCRNLFAENLELIDQWKLNDEKSTITNRKTKTKN